MAKLPKLSASDKNTIIEILEKRFVKNKHLHTQISWEDVLAKLSNNEQALYTLMQMEATDGEPDVIGSNNNGEYIYVDCAIETPKARRSLCYDQAALDSRKEHKPKGNAVSMAESFGARLVDEATYLALQNLGDFDLKTSSWLLAPASVREKGGAIFGDKRYGRTFIYHNGAESYYAARGFRCMLFV